MDYIANHINEIRAQFPALSKKVDGKSAVFLDGPAGTQVTQSVIDAIGHYLIHHNANHAGMFATSIESDALLDQVHRAAADFLGCDDPDEIAFGANMTTMTLALSRALAATWAQGDNIVLSGLEHDANYTPWRLAARDAGVEIRVVEIDSEDCTLQVEQYADFIDQRTRLVAVGCASNAVGTINPVKQICEWAKQAGALSFLDAVHYAPHDLIDVADWGCDFLICSAYKFFGPHVGMMYGRRELLESLQPYKLRPSPDDLPGRWMTGTQNHECIAGTMAAIDHVASLTEVEGTRRERLRAAFGEIRSYENNLLTELLDGLAKLSGYKVWGIVNPDRRSQRLPTVSITHASLTSRELAKRLGEEGIFAWHGNYYALPLTERIGVEPEGMLRVGLVHYNTSKEVARLLAVLESLDRVGLGSIAALNRACVGSDMNCN